LSLFLELISFFAGHSLEGPVYFGGELLVEKCLDLRSLEAKEPVEAEIKVGRIKLKQLAEEIFHPIQAFIRLHQCCPN
jgi:hypothetical protein